MTNVILLLAGDSTRFNCSTKNKINKNLIRINEKELFLYPLINLTHNKNIDNIVLVTKENEINLVKDIVFNNSPFLNNKLNNIYFIVGGKSRQESVFKALNFINKNFLDILDSLILVHDSARVLLFNESINLILNEFNLNTDLIGASLIKNISDSLITNIDNKLNYLDRDQVKFIVTPQVFKYKDLFNAHKETNKSFTDDLSLLLDFKKHANIKLITDPNINIKLTTQEDLELIKILLNNNNFISKLLKFDYNI